ncbi:MAG: chain-length determining protein [Holophagaceae bacterium]|nr:chain-length determining protein [Holophagaceae bacterium]
MTESPDLQMTRPRIETTHRPPKPPEEAPEIDLLEWLLNLWMGRRIILVFVLTFTVLGALYAWQASPIYKAEALLQIEPPSTFRNNDAVFTKMGDLFSQPSDALTEIEIIGSNRVLGNTVTAMNLDIEASPKRAPLIGKLLNRITNYHPALKVDHFEVPDSLLGHSFTIKANGDGSFVALAPDTHAPLATGRPGDEIVANYGGATLRFTIRSLVAKPGQQFTLIKRPILDAITDLRDSLEAGEKGGSSSSGRPTNLLTLTMRDANPERAALVLNEVMKQYVLQNANRKNGQISQTIQTLEQQLPQVRAEMKETENRLNSFRTSRGAMDPSRQAEVAMQQSSALQSQISALRQRKEELRRTYQESSDVITTLNEQIARLEGERAIENRKVQTMPTTQQEMERLSRDAQVTKELYTGILNNLQQLRITGTASGHSTQIIDFAQTSPRPIKPKKPMIIASFFMFGLFSGVSLALLRRSLRRGVEDYKIIEEKLGLPVLVTIPHSDAQTRKQKSAGLSLLAHHTPDDLATESLRGLRTMIHLSLMPGDNNIILITGPTPRIGKSFVAANFATVMAQTGARVLLIDADLRRGCLHRTFGLPDRSTGLTEVISGSAKWREAAQHTEVKGLDLMTTGNTPANPAEMLMSETFPAFLRTVSTEYDYIIIDAPPLLPVTDAAIVASLAGTVLLVAKYGQHPLEEIRASLRRVSFDHFILKGCIFNDITPTGLTYFDQHYRYTYHYAYEKSN